LLDVPMLQHGSQVEEVKKLIQITRFRLEVFKCGVELGPVERQSDRFERSAAEHELYVRILLIDDFANAVFIERAGRREIDLSDRVKCFVAWE
jgi:hypothetical protein